MSDRKSNKDSDADLEGYRAEQGRRLREVEERQSNELAAVVWDANLAEAHPEALYEGIIGYGTHSTGAT